MNIFRNLIPESVKRYYRVFLSILGEIRFGFPAKDLILIGVTGTSGKSTTTNLIFHILQSADIPTGVVSTVGARVGNKSIDTGLHVTTPDPYDLQKLLGLMKKKHARYVVIETSSHALAQGRLGRIKFDCVVITNIKRDHLDWHKTWEHYASSKASIVKRTRRDAKVVLNREDKEMYAFVGKYMKDNKLEDREVITYSLNEATDVEETAIGTRFTLLEQDYKLSLLGLYNIENAMAAINVAQLVGLNYQQISSGLASFIGLEGRMQVMQPTPFVVIVDFAHNTDSLEKSLISARKLVDIKGKLICVFGSAGLRDVEKRYSMGETSANLADVTVITSEDPRTESLEKINSQIIEGADRSGGRLVKRFANTDEYKEYEIRPVMINKGDVFVFDEETVNSRYDAIEFACRIARPGDVVITEGKGHEQSLCFGTTEYPFNDQNAVKRALERLKG